jgi:hypothetical protein
VVKRALRAEHNAIREYRLYAHARHCFGLGPQIRVAKRVARSSSAAVWEHARRRWHLQAEQFHARTAKLLYAMKHPPGAASGTKWLPLARHCGWPEYALSTLARIIYRESTGREHAYNGVIGCSGLLQIWPGHVSAADRQRLFDAEFNLTVGLRLWRSQGWSPWALTY